MKRMELFAALCAGALFTGCVTPDGESELDDSEIAEDGAEEIATAQQALDQFDGDRMGGNGGSYYEQPCPSGFVGIGSIQAPTPAGTMVRQFALICGPRAQVNLGLAVPSAEQWIIWSSWRMPTIPGYSVLIPAGNGPRSAFALAQAPNSVEALCGAGYAMTNVTGRAGALVDRISSITCEWQPSTASPHPIYSIQVNVGGWGGTPRNSPCHRWEPDLGVIDQISNGLHFRSGDQLDALGLLCTP